jgi:hypothetical protein
MTNVTSATPLVTPVQKAVYTSSTSGDNTAIAAVAGARFRVLGVSVNAVAANLITFKSNTTAISGVMPLAAGVQMLMPYTEHGWFETAVGEALTLNQSVASAVGGQILYIKLLS